MMEEFTLQERLFSLSSAEQFEALAIDICHYQYENVPVYRQYCQAINRDMNTITSLQDIPFLPIQFFKSHQIQVKDQSTAAIFSSSGTTGSVPSKHYVADLKIYEQTFHKAFEEFYGELEDYVVLALLPSYLERQGSSLIYMAQAMIEESRHAESGFYLNNYEELSRQLRRLNANGQKVLLIGVSFALLELVEREQFQLTHTIVMETGGMKGRRKELTRHELHTVLKHGFGVAEIHSEYGMTELLSQAYSLGNGRFQCPSTMKIMLREPEDPFHILPKGRSGGLNVIDLANLYSCAFIATQDLGREYADGSFEILGRFDHSDIRGCNLMML